MSYILIMIFGDLNSSIKWTGSKELSMLHLMIIQKFEKWVLVSF